MPTRLPTGSGWARRRTTRLLASLCVLVAGASGRAAEDAPAPDRLQISIAALDEPQREQLLWLRSICARPESQRNLEIKTERERNLEIKTDE